MEVDTLPGAFQVGRVVICVAARLFVREFRVFHVVRSAAELRTRLVVFHKMFD